MQSGPDTTTEANHEGARLMSDEWIRENMPISARQWEESDERNVDKDADLDGFWLLWFLTPERRERTIRVFWVGSIDGSTFSADIGAEIDAEESFRAIGVSHSSAGIRGYSVRYCSNHFRKCESGQFRS